MRQAVRKYSDLEQEIGDHIATRLDLIGGISIGGILAPSVARELPAQRMVNLFEMHGEEIFMR